MKYKKLLAVLLAAVLVLGLLSACTPEKKDEETQAAPTLPTPERRPGETGASDPSAPAQNSVEGSEASGETGESAQAASGEGGEQNPGGENADPNGNSSANPGGSQSGANPTPTGAETDEDLYHVEPDTDDSDENLG